MVVEEKLDGSIALLFWFEGAWRWASKGSFDSTHVLMMQEVWGESYAHAERALDQDWTYMFELIHPANFIGVQYGAEKALVLLSMFRANGEERPHDFDYAALPFPRPQVTDIDKLDYEALRCLNRNNEEGFVLKFFRTPDDTRPPRVKVKFESYLELINQKSGISPAAIVDKYVNSRSNIPCLGHKEAQAKLAEVHETFAQNLIPLADDFGGEKWIADVLGVWDAVVEAFGPQEEGFSGLLEELEKEGYVPKARQEPELRAAFAKELAKREVPEK